MTTVMDTSTIIRRGGYVHELETRTTGIGSAAPLGVGTAARSRPLARRLPKHMPGKPTVIVQNMPGGNSIIAANYLYSSAKPDGLTLGTFNRNLPIAQLTAVQGVKFDMRKFAWIGSAANETTVLTIR